MAKEHQTVNQVRADEASTASDEDALALLGREELDWGEAGEGAV